MALAKHLTEEIQSRETHQLFQCLHRETVELYKINKEINRSKKWSHQNSDNDIIGGAFLARLQHLILQNS